MKLLIATQNRHKVHEFRQLLPGHSLVTPGELGLPGDHQETGDSFLANALSKARYFGEHYRRMNPDGPPLPVLADDSGLCVRALDDRPGVFSARYGATATAPTPSPDHQIELLLSELAGVADRRAFYVCCCVVYLDVDRFLVAQETWDGVIAAAPAHGTTGFGYDPIFVVAAGGGDEPIAVADLQEAEKNRFSHRARAVQRLLPVLADITEHGGINR